MFQKIHSRNLNDILHLHHSLDKQFDPFKHYKVDAYLYACGLAVHPGEKLFNVFLNGFFYV
jgi:hypothetical protein